MKTIDQEVLDAYLEWGEETFPDATAESCILHLRQEVEELLYAIEHLSLPSQREEAGDCLMLVLHAMKKLGMHPTEELERKLGINKKRKWKPNDQGFSEHVE